LSIFLDWEGAIAKVLRERQDNQLDVSVTQTERTASGHVFEAI